MSGKGHNSGDVLAVTKLREVVQRIERLNEEKAALTADIGELYKVAKNDGFDVKVLRAFIRRRKQDKADLAEFDDLLAAYEGALS